MPRIKKIINGEYIEGTSYSLEQRPNGKVKLTFNPDEVITPGTAIGAEEINEIQKNGVYSCTLTRTVVGQKEIYTANLTGFEEFGKFELILQCNFLDTNTTQTPFLRIENTEYQIQNVTPGKLRGEVLIKIRDNKAYPLNLLSEEVENNNKIGLSLLGALNLKNWLVTNYTSLMNNIKEALDTKIETLKASLTSLINTKLNHGGYEGSGQDLKNLVDSKVSKNGDTMSGTLMLPIQNQFMGLRDGDININSRLSSGQFFWGYTGTTAYDACTNLFPTNSNANGILSFNTHGGDYGHQLGLSGNGKLYHRSCTGSTGFNNWDFFIKNGYIKQINSANDTLESFGSYKVGDTQYEGVKPWSSIINLSPQSNLSSLQLSFYHGGNAVLGEVRMRTVSDRGEKSQWVPLVGKVSYYSGAEGLNAINNSPLAWNANSERILALLAGNNKMGIWVSDKDNSRQANIQVGHASPDFANALGTLNLNPFGGSVLINGSPVVTKNKLNQNGRIWQGSSYSVRFTLPGGIESWHDVLYLQCVGGNDSCSLDGYFIAGMANNSQVILGYVQGGNTDMTLVFTKVDSRTGIFTQNGSGTTGGGDQTYPITNVFIRQLI